MNNENSETLGEKKVEIIKSLYVEWLLKKEDEKDVFV